jgi:excinuclease ABC subunit C
MQRIRDEAHRFANRYNELLLRKRVKESLLDDCPGVSPAKKKALLKRFGSVARIKEVSVEQIAELTGFSVKSADEILAFLKGKT